ncbi:MAG: endonuclease/exonuclease/phosphatase family protein [Tenuifilaceae bacterium]|jgi:endonuclease/exonuclease/phosphatase family metal-dependent hydrolase|nr:endonuclease/exonuclease/phosphatase family protein [Tenuifilaceae bacterium]
MKRFVLIFAIPLVAVIGCKLSNSSVPLNVISYNIRFDNPTDGVNAWPNRKADVAALLRFHGADIACLQEALYHQITDLQDQLPYLSWVGVGRDDGEMLGEYSPILFNSQRFTLDHWDTFWLSSTPEKPSLGWDAACIRICTYAKFSDKQSKQSFFVFNTHFDHVGVAARANAAKLIIKRISEIANDIPVILAGDFNTNPEGDPYALITQSLADSYLISSEPPYGPVATWNGFDYSSALDQRIDYIFVNDKFSVYKYANLSDSKDQHFPSDHLPVFVRLGFVK